MFAKLKAFVRKILYAAAIAAFAVISVVEWIAFLAILGAGVIAVFVVSLVYEVVRWALLRLWDLFEHVSDIGLVAVVAGIALLGAPTLFTVFPNWGTNWPLGRKLGTISGWTVAVLIIVARTVRHERETHRVLVERELAPLRGRSRLRTVHQSLSALLAPAVTGLPEDHHLQVFVPDPPSHPLALLPAYDPASVGPEEGWRIRPPPAQAVTGQAWETNSYVLAQGDAVSDSTHGLTAEQQERYRNLTGVAATPIRDESGDLVGVLTATTESPHPQVGEPDFIRSLIAQTDALSRILIDIGRVRG